jgi:hypothetical protein
MRLPDSNESLPEMTPAMAKWAETGIATLQAHANGVNAPSSTPVPVEPAWTESTRPGQRECDFTRRCECPDCRLGKRDPRHGPEAV